MFSTTNQIAATSVQAMLKKVGIDATLDPRVFTQLQQVTNLGGTWDGLIWGNRTTVGDPVSPLGRMYGPNTDWFKMMLRPPDYLDAVAAAVAAPDFRSKQKATWEVQKLITDKYCLLCWLFNLQVDVVSQSRVHNTGFNVFPGSGAWWTPEEAWLSK